MTIPTVTIKLPCHTMHLLIGSVIAIESGIVMVEKLNRVWQLFPFLDFEARRWVNFHSIGAVNGPFKHYDLLVRFLV